MQAPTSPLEDALGSVPRRFRLPAKLTMSGEQPAPDPARSIAFAMENARLALAQGRSPVAESKRQFVDGLARMIHDAMQDEGGDPVFQAMVLRHRQASVREFASLSAHAESDLRAVHAAVNRIAHPAKQQREPPGPRRDALIRLHALAAAASWQELQHAAQQFLQMPVIADEAGSRRTLEFLANSAEVRQLQRLAVLCSNPLVLQYQSLWNRKLPDAGSAEAIAGGNASQKRGAAVEALAVQALQALADRLNKEAASSAGTISAAADRHALESYRVVSSMRVPASIPASHDRAKAEWDAVLLRRVDAAHGVAGDAASDVANKMANEVAGDDAAAETSVDVAVWDVCLLVEAKASIEAATNDLPQLLRGLALLAHARADSVYSFMTRQGQVLLSGASLHALENDWASLARTVLYCCDAPVEKMPRLLSAASRMQLLSAQSSLEFASAVSGGKHPDPECLGSLWHEMLASVRWKPVLNQYATLVQVRALMVHPDDLMSSANNQDPGQSEST